MIKAILSRLRKAAPNPATVLGQMVRALHLKVAPATISSCLDEHPESNSVLSLSQCLEDWDISNNAYKIKPEDYNPADLLFPVIAHCRPSGGTYILLHSIAEGVVTYSDHLKKQAVMTEQDFLKIWDGVLLHAEPVKESGEKNYAASRFKGKLEALRIPAFAFTAAMLFTILLTTAASTWSTGILACIKIAGLAVSVALLIQSIDANNPLIKTLCSLGKKNDCNAILKSDAAKLASWLSWSEVGFFYFAGSLLALLLVPSSLNFLVLLSFLTLPYTIYSINYQYRAKNWCILCCTVQAILWVEALTFLATFFFLPAFQPSSFREAFFLPPSSFLPLILSFLVPITTWSFLKPFFQQAARVRPLNTQLKKFKYNSDLFNKALTSQPRFAVPDALMPVMLGNPEAETVITMVSNPFCGPCAAAHKTLDSWLATRNDIRVKIIFATADNDDDPKTQVSRHISALSRSGNTAMVELALNAWYNSTKKDYADWAKEFPADISGFDIVTSRQKEWCEMAEVKFTPTILVNGYKLPDPYRLEDIKYLVE